MKKFIVLLILQSSGLLAGTGMGGGTPPSRQQLEEQLMSARFPSAALFDNGEGGVSLLSNRELQPELTLSKDLLSIIDLKISDADFEKLRDRKEAIDTVGSRGENRSFAVSAGDRIDSLYLVDRRATARASVVQ